MWIILASGVTKAQRVTEHASIAHKYHNRSVAEQDSVDVAWDILMNDLYQDLRRCIFETDTEGRRFQQLMVNSVLQVEALIAEVPA